MSTREFGDAGQAEGLLAATFRDQTRTARRALWFTVALATFVALATAGLAFYGWRLKDRVEDLGRERDAIRQEIEELRKERQVLERKVTRYRSVALDAFGVPEPVRATYDADPVKMSTLLDTNDAFRTVADRVPRAERASTQLQYYARATDRSEFEPILSGMGFQYRSLPSRTRAPSDTVFFGPDVPIDHIRLVALALIRAGHEVYSIRPFERFDRVDRTLIQVGHDEAATRPAPYTAAEILAATRFP